MRVEASCRRAGFSLVEMACVLAVIGLIVAGLMWFWSDNNESALTSDTRREVVTILAAIDDLYSGQPDFSALTSHSIAGSGLLPNKWAAGGNLSTPFRSKLELEPAMGGSGYTLAMQGLPPGACRKLLMADMGGDVLFVTTQNGASQTVQGVLTPQQADQACFPAMANGLTQIAWTFAGGPAASAAPGAAAGTAGASSTTAASSSGTPAATQVASSGTQSSAASSPAPTPAGTPAPTTGSPAASGTPASPTPSPSTATATAAASSPSTGPSGTTAGGSSAATGTPAATTPATQAPASSGAGAAAAPAPQYGFALRGGSMAYDLHLLSDGSFSYTGVTYFSSTTLWDPNRNFYGGTTSATTQEADPHWFEMTFSGSGTGMGVQGDGSTSGQVAQSGYQLYWVDGSNTQGPNQDQSTHVTSMGNTADAQLIATGSSANGTGFCTDPNGCHLFNFIPDTSGMFGPNHYSGFYDLNYNLSLNALGKTLMAPLMGTTDDASVSAFQYGTSNFFLSTVTSGNAGDTWFSYNYGSQEMRMSFPDQQGYVAP